MPISNFHSTICIAEDRKSCEEALKLLLVTLRQHNGNSRIVLFYPPSDHSFGDYVRQLNFAEISLRTTPFDGTRAWNVKPHALMQLLDEGNDEVLWIDSDILVTKDVYSDLRGLDPSLLVATEEGLMGQNETEPLRAQLWGFPIKRRFRFPLNTGVLRATKAHIPLLVRWKQLLESELYIAAQAQPMNMRPKHMLSDQDVLTALLCSEQFHHIPLKVLRRGRDIIQFYEQAGFTVRERLICSWYGMPTFIHQQGWKPWMSHHEKLQGFRGTLISAYQDLSPYTVIAQAVAPTANYLWMRPRSQLSSILRAISFGIPQGAGLPLAIVFDLERLVHFPKKVLRALLLRFAPKVLTLLKAKRSSKLSGRDLPFRDSGS